MGAADSFRRQARATWSSGDWDSFAQLIRPVGRLIVDRVGIVPGLRLLDVGTGSGGNIAIPAAELGADVVGLDITPELLAHARRRAAEAGVEVQWIEGDAQELPFAEASFDRVTSTFGAMFAPDHVRAAAELVRVCRPDGRVAMTTWVNDGFVGELFTLTGSFMPAPPPGVEPPPLWGVEAHINAVFGAVGVAPSVERQIVDFEFVSVDDAVERYTDHFGPLVTARAALEPQGREKELTAAFQDLVARFNPADDGTCRVRSDYFVILINAENRPASS